jgi:biotin carboxyl carrier protein
VVEEIRAEMVGTVLSVVAREGDRVVDGDTLLVLESMKMEIPVLAECTGTVSRIAVQAGAVVQSGDLVAVLER